MNAAAPRAETAAAAPPTAVRLELQPLQPFSSGSVGGVTGSLPSSSAFSYYSTDIPGSGIGSVASLVVQHSDWLTQLNLQILDNGDMLNSVPSFFNASVDNSSSDYRCSLRFRSRVDISANDKFIDALRDYINRRQDLSSVNRHQMISCALSRAFLTITKSNCSNRRASCR